MPMWCHVAIHYIYSKVKGILDNFGTRKNIQQIILRLE